MGVSNRMPTFRAENRIPTQVFQLSLVEPFEHNSLRKRPNKTVRQSSLDTLANFAR